MRRDEEVRPIVAEIVAGNANHRAIAIPLIDRMPVSAKTPILDKGSDTDRIREKLKEKEIEARIPSRAKTGWNRFRAKRKNASGVGESRESSGASRVAEHRHAPRRLPRPVHGRGRLRDHRHLSDARILSRKAA